MLTLLVGLGNPGPQYAPTRHNAGAWLGTYLANKLQQSLSLKTALNAQLTGIINFAGHKLIIALPTTYMNLSGIAVHKLLNYFKLTPQQLMVAHDEIDLAAASIRYKVGGGLAGHNGLKSIASSINSQEFTRIRIGIGHPGTKEEVADYVLAKPKTEEYDAIMQQIIDFCQNQLPVILKARHGI